ncbi:MAG: hypothetical protein V2A67_06965, partial [Bacteroidota bacterium]
MEKLKVSICGHVVAMWLLIMVGFPYALISQNNRVVNWQADIDYLVKQLETMHPNLYGCVTKEAFGSSTEKLKQKIQTSSDVEMFLGIQELVASIRNGHTICLPALYMNIPEELQNQFLYYLPGDYYFYED